MNDLDLCLEVVSRSCQLLRGIRRWISRKPLEIEDWFQRNMGYQMVTWPMTSRDPRRCCEAVRSAILATAWLLVLWAVRSRYDAVSTFLTEPHWLTYLLMSVNGTMFVFSVYDLGVLVYACLLDRQESISWSRSWNQTGYVLWHYLFLAVRHSRIHTVTEWYRKKSLKCMTSSINPESTSMSRNAWSIRRPTNRCQTARCSHNRRTVLYDTSHDTLTLLFDG